MKTKEITKADAAKNFTESVASHLGNEKPKAVTRKRAETTRMSVAKFFEHQLALSEKSQSLIASECGFASPNMVSLIKSGKTKFPMNKVEVMANALEVDPRLLLRLCMEEYSPEIWAVIVKILGKQSTVSVEELQCVELIRSANGGRIPSLSNGQNVAILRDAVAACVENDIDRNEQTAEALSKIPPNNRGKFGPGDV